MYRFSSFGVLSFDVLLLESIQKVKTALICWKVVLSSRKINPTSATDHHTHHQYVTGAQKTSLSSILVILVILVELRVISFTRKMNMVYLKYKLCGACIICTDYIKDFGVFFYSKLFFISMYTIYLQKL
jgi:hypothetical protein